MLDVGTLLQQKQNRAHEARLKQDTEHTRATNETGKTFRSVRAFRENQDALINEQDNIYSNSTHSSHLKREEKYLKEMPSQKTDTNNGRDEATGY